MGVGQHGNQKPSYNQYFTQPSGEKKMSNGGGAGKPFAPATFDYKPVESKVPMANYTWKAPHKPSKNPESGANYHWTAPAYKSAGSGYVESKGHYTPAQIDRRYAPFAGIPIGYSWKRGVQKKRRYQRRKKRFYKPPRITY